MAILKDLIVTGDSRVTGNEYVTGSMTLGTSGTISPGNTKAVTGGTVYNALTKNGTTITVNTSNYFAPAGSININFGSATTVKGGFTLYLTADKTSSADAGNTKYTGSNGIIYVKYYGTSTSITAIPEWIIRNGCRNGDCRIQKAISGTTLTLTIWLRCKKDDSPTIWNVNLLSNDSSYTITPTWNTGAPTSYAKSSVGGDFGNDTYTVGITSGKVMLSKWAGEDCSLEKDGHCLDGYTDQSLYDLGFSVSTTYNDLNNIFLFPEHTSKYTVYAYSTGDTNHHWPLSLTTYVPCRCTVSRVSTRSDSSMITDATYYWVEQEAEMIYNGITDAQYIMTFKRSGYVSGANPTTHAGSCTWGPWRLVGPALDYYEVTGSITANRTIYLPPAHRYNLETRSSAGGSVAYNINYILPSLNLLPPTFMVRLSGGSSNSGTNPPTNTLYMPDGTTILEGPEGYNPTSGYESIYMNAGNTLVLLGNCQGSSPGGGSSTGTARFVRK